MHAPGAAHHMVMTVTITPTRTVERTSREFRFALAGAPRVRFESTGNTHSPERATVTETTQGDVRVVIIELASPDGPYGSETEDAWVWPNTPVCRHVGELPADLLQGLLDAAGVTLD